MVTMDTLKAARVLTDAGFGREQAEALVEVVADHSRADLATKTDVARLERDISDLDAKLDQVEHRLDAKIDQVEQRLDAKIDRVASEQDLKLGQAIARQNVVLLTGMATLIGLALAVASLLGL